MLITQSNVISVSDFDELVIKTYQRPYSFQQQDGCKDRGTCYITVPEYLEEEYTNDTVPEEVNHEDMGVSFKAWLARDPDQLLSNLDDQEPWSLELWWQRNFYPDVQMVVNDLYEKGLIPAGDYMILIDW